MANISPSRLVIKCIGQRQKNGKYLGVCLDFDLAAEADTPEELQEKLREIIQSYIDVVLDSADQASKAELLNRRAPFKYWAAYYFLRLFHSFRQIKSIFVFNQYLPFRLSRSNC